MAASMSASARAAKNGSCSASVGKPNRLTHYQAKRGALYVLKDATRPAEAFAQQHGITIRDGRDLAGRAKAQLSEVKLNELLNSRDHHCPKCESRMVWRTGDFTPFWGCSTYPRCRGVLKHSGAR